MVVAANRNVENKNLPAKLVQRFAQRLPAAGQAEEMLKELALVLYLTQKIRAEMDGKGLDEQ